MANYKSLNPQKALIWRIVHKDNLPWILANGLYAGSSQKKAADWVSIGNMELIERRKQRKVPVAPGGTLNDYIPFYFTPFSPMLYNIHTGRGGVARQANEDIVILVSSLHRLQQQELIYVFTDRHAYTPMAGYYSHLAQLDKIDWELLQQRNFHREPDKPEQIERYQAEALVHQHLPVAALLGIVCYSSTLQEKLQKEFGHLLNIQCLPGWYFNSGGSQ
ncbi:DUF4433 domain-containing protein [Serratia liquefaciens]|uniref:type II toxin-antitoxin system toxin DNA ADP-ribosyl transferase DarT n=1 Tax=Serratia liquefaciens TaxID=614 RepID=UPI0022DD4A54|nr:DUF4433 domain-containing protein [Serratia liquefaciens]WBL70681.1 DUF4433 domain-containing protein [Serratia liquefaciens]